MALTAFNRGVSKITCTRVLRYPASRVSSIFLDQSLPLPTDLGRSKRLCSQGSFTLEKCFSTANYFKNPYCLIFLYNYLTFMTRILLFSDAYIDAKQPLVAREKKISITRIRTRDTSPTCN